jgi:phosphatidylglycerophosphatase A
MIHRLALTLSSACYIGFIPGAPGTYASLATVVALYLVQSGGGVGSIANSGSQPLPLLPLLIAVCLVTLVGIPASNITSKKAGDEDPSYVVIDEVAGQLLTFLYIPFSVTNIVLGFIAFRTFDIWKPWPIRKLEPLPHGVGIMADDLLAGVYGCVALHLVNMLLIFLRSIG